MTKYILVMLVLVTSSARAEGFKFDIPKNSMGFVKKVVRSCLSSPDSFVTDLSSSEISVVDRSPACAAEIQSLAKHWNHAPDSFGAVYAPDEAGKSVIAKKLHARFPDRISIEAQKHCPCLIVSGTAIEEAIAFARKK